MSNSREGSVRGAPALELGGSMAPAARRARTGQLLGAVLPKGIPAPLWRSAWSLRRGIGLSPTQKVFREIRRRGVDTRRLAALEVFAGTGFTHTIDYARLVGSLELWELSRERERALRTHFPRAIVRITDTFEEVRRTKKKFGLIVVDNTVTTYGDGYVEHFDLFPDLFRIADDACIMLLNVCPKLPERQRTDPRRIARRAEFYETATPHDISWDRIVGAYARLMVRHGFALDWQFARPRAYRESICYLAMRIVRSAAASTSDA